MPGLRFHTLISCAPLLASGRPVLGQRDLWIEPTGKRFAPVMVTSAIGQSVFVKNPSNCKRYVGGVQAVRSALPFQTGGFIFLKEHGKLDLSVEALLPRDRMERIVRR